MTKSLLNYNAFGFIAISPENITASVTIVQDQKPFTRKIYRTYEIPLEQLHQSDHAILTFAAWLEKGKKARISAQEIVGLKSGTPVSQIPQVDEVLNEAISLIRKDAGI